MVFAMIAPVRTRYAGLRQKLRAADRNGGEKQRLREPAERA